ncbi:hypothetical protein LFYK43_03430 [Ligilactobacillus salitolerans]|uniref:NAD(P)-binding domain-containing protein n=1 Tax=Ligilactobacillus salitolerans TaxID=1808352 RepID=A0A401IQW4_9LACO|nr:NAD(P)H-binding protein [Ligilactobacillus salitolerans]GBG93884.1 hypothetical protein LFYK43_03430 [Ligilactobacillus salitolerans]
MSVLVTGATGGYGGAALDALKKLLPNDEIYALARTEEKAAKLKEQGFNVRLGNYDDQAALQEAFTGIDRLLFVSSSELDKRQAQHKNVVAAAKESGVSYIAYTSFGKADTSTSPLAADHAYTEKLILDAEIAHTFLRNNWYLENEGAAIAGALKSGKLVHGGGDGLAGWGLRQEYAEIGARAVSGKFDFPAILEVGGPLISYQQLAADLEQASGEKITAVAADPAEVAKFLEKEAGLPQGLAEGLVGSQAIIKSGSLAVEPDDMEKYLGRPLTPTVQALRRFS